MKIAIVMTYFNRQYQLDQTLRTISKTNQKDIEVIIVDDCSDVAPNIGSSDFPITVYRTENKKWLDGSPAYNLGIFHAIKKKPDIIILQNAETYHVGDVIDYASRVTNDSYISFGCYNLSKGDTFKEHNITEIIKNNARAVDNEANAWLNHKTIRPMGYHWCSAITTQNMIRLNGFDEGFSDGYCFEDDELLARVRMLGLKVEITDYPFVVHQWHDRNYVPANWSPLYRKNKDQYDRLVAENNHVAKHYITPDFYV
jgi:glycosyltransferase involved in cell wall biosynthesis